MSKEFNPKFKLFDVVRYKSHEQGEGILEIRKIVSKINDEGIAYYEYGHNDSLHTLIDESDIVGVYKFEPLSH